MAAVEYTIVKAASSGDLETCEKIMREIYQENPRHWPYGLTTDQLRGNLYMVRQASTNEPVGFVGWQEAREGLRKVGYYSIGILPQYRQQGFAKSAVQQIITEKSAGVDEVRALIHYTNQPSLELAEALHVPVEKVASRLGQAGHGAVAGAALYPMLVSLLRLNSGSLGEHAKAQNLGDTAIRGALLGGGRWPPHTAAAKGGTEGREGKGESCRLAG
jgi:GNAT superfamily N-acetyltransferase